MLEINTTYNQSVLFIALSGSLDSRSGFDFHEYITEKILDGILYFSLDCNELEFISSGGISTLVGIHRILKKRGGLINLFSVQEEVKHVFYFLSLDKVLSIHENQELALEQQSLEQKKNPKNKPPANALFEKRKKTNIDDENISFITKKKTEQKKFAEKKELENIFLEPDDYKIKEKDSFTSQATTNQEEKELAVTVYCSKCGRKLLIKKPGMHMCPTCQNKFRYPAH